MLEAARDRMRACRGLAGSTWSEAERRFVAGSAVGYRHIGGGRAEMRPNRCPDNLPMRVIERLDLAGTDRAPASANAA
jgi:hypothetical protein